MHGGGHFLNITLIIAIILPVLSFVPMCIFTSSLDFSFLNLMDSTAFVFSIDLHQLFYSCAIIGIRYSDALASTSFYVSSLNSIHALVLQHDQIFSHPKQNRSRHKGIVPLYYKYHLARAPWTVLKEVFKNKDGLSK